MSDSLSSRATAFLDDLDGLCRRHAIQLVVDSDGVVVLWPLEDDDEPVVFELIADELDDGVDTDDDIELDIEVDVEPEADARPEA
ncbi:MAG: hypothetical protein U1F53_02745 [Burkholderiaceae bacterium]